MRGTEDFRVCKKFPLMNHEHSPEEWTLVRANRRSRYSWLSRWSTTENDNGSAARCNSDSKKTDSVPSRGWCDDCRKNTAQFSDSPAPGRNRAEHFGSAEQSRRAANDVVRQVPQHRLGVGIRQAIEGVGRLFGVPLGALPGVIERAGLLEMRPEPAPELGIKRR